MDLEEIKNIQEAIRYIEECLRDRDESTDDESVAAGIVGLGCNDNHAKWCEDKDFDLIMANASDLEWSNGSPVILRGYWQDIDSALARLKARYKV